MKVFWKIIDLHALAKLKSVTIKAKRMMFKQLVLSSLLTGLECEVLRTCDYERLEQNLLGLARRAAGSPA